MQSFAAHYILTPKLFCPGNYSNLEGQFPTIPSLPNTLRAVAVCPARSPHYVTIWSGCHYSMLWENARLDLWSETVTITAEQVWLALESQSFLFFPFLFFSLRVLGHIYPSPLSVYFCHISDPGHVTSYTKTPFVGGWGATMFPSA